MTASPQLRWSRLFSVCALFPVVLAVLLAGPLCRAQVFVQIPAPHTTLVIFADHQLTDDQWTALVAELRKSQEIPATKIPMLAGDFEVLRGEDIAHGVRVENGISVFLHGHCTLMPGPRYVVTGALGWVPRIDGHIEPFIHVDCARIEEMLGPRVLGMRVPRRNTVMAEAVVRVLIHEWMHIAMQTARHTEEGIRSSQFTIEDLLAEDKETHPRQNAGREKKQQAGF